MRKKIHPEYKETTITCACGEVIHTRATKQNIKVEICSKEPFDYHIDGELVRTTDAVDGLYTVGIKVIPQQISFLVPGAFYRKFHPFELD